jgi:hypothetical protein
MRFRREISREKDGADQRLQCADVACHALPKELHGAGAGAGAASEGIPFLVILSADPATFQRKVSLLEGAFRGDVADLREPEVKNCKIDEFPVIAQSFACTPVFLITVARELSLL